MAIAALALPSTSVAAPTRDIREVQSQVRDLQMSAASATERYNDAQGRLRETQQRLVGIENKVRREKNELAVSMASVNDLARGVYMSGGIDNSLQVLLADDPTDFLAQSAALDMVAQSQAASLRKTRTAQLRLAQSEAQLVDQETIAKDFRDEMDAAKGEADERLAAAQAVLDSLQEAERQRLAALEAQQREQSLAAAQQASAAVASSSGGGSDSGGAGAAGGGYSGGGRAAAAVQYALSQVGKSYVAAAAGPSSFDCSGLTMAA